MASRRSEISGRRAFLAISLTAISIGCRPSEPSAGDPFIGDWKLDPSRSKVSDLMKVQSLDGNRYALDFGGGSETIAADGTDQPGTSGTTLSVTIEGPADWKVVRKKNGNMFISALWKLSQDGNSLSDDYTEFAKDGQISLHASYLYHRTADGSGFAGAWEGTLPMASSQSATLQIRRYEADGLSFSYPSADVTRRVKFDGKDYPTVGHGAAEGSTSSARWVDNHTLELTDKTQGKITRTSQIEISHDHKTVTQTARPVGQQGPTIFVFERQ